MCLGFGVVGIVAASLAFFDVTVNVLVMKLNEGMHDFMEKNETHLRDSFGGRAHRFSADSMGQVNSAEENEFAPQVKSKDPSQLWEEVVDPESGSSYWFNATTGETTWDHPK